MTCKNILAWTLVWTLAALLLVAWVALAEAGPRKAPVAAREPVALLPALTASEQICRALGIFAYRRATERDRGATFTDVMSVTRQFDGANDTEPALRAWHERIVHAIFTVDPLTPTATRQIAELACLENEKTRTDHPATPPRSTPDARLRY